MYIEPSDLLSCIPEDVRVLDLGGWERVFSRANAIADFLPYETWKRSTSYGETELFTKDMSSENPPWAKTMATFI